MLVREDASRSPACGARPLSRSCPLASLLRSVGWSSWLLPLLCPFLGPGPFFGGWVLIGWFSHLDGGVPFPGWSALLGFCPRCCCLWYWVLRPFLRLLLCPGRLLGCGVLQLGACCLLLCPLLWLVGVCGGVP